MVYVRWIKKKKNMKQKINKKRTRGRGKSGKEVVWQKELRVHTYVYVCMKEDRERVMCVNEKV